MEEKVPFQLSLAAARVNANLTQEYVAKELKINKATVVNWEKGNSEPQISQARELSKLYKIPIDYLFFKS